MNGRPLRGPCEAAFTAPSAWCARPDLWHADDEQATEHEVTELLAALARATQPALVVETGAYRGQTTVALADALRRNGHGRLCSLERDPLLAETASAALRRLGLDPSAVVEADTLAWEPPAPIDLLFVDGHLDRIAELAHLRRFLPPGALVAVHDSRPGNRYDGLEIHAELHGADAAGAFRAIDLRTPRGLTLLEVLT